MSIRRSLVILVAAIAVLLVAMGLPGCGGGKASQSLVASPLVDEAAETPLFTFACIGDPHIGAPDEGYWMKAGRFAPSLLANAVRDINKRGVDFTVVLGDLSQNDMLGQFKKAKSILDSLTAPYIPIVGNHDNYKNNSFAYFRQVFGTTTERYSWDHKGFHFVTAAADMPTAHDTVHWYDDNIKWVQDDLRKNASKPTILVTHHNLFDYTDIWVQRAPRNSEAFRKVLEGEKNFVMSISGHAHRFRYRYTTAGYATIGATLVHPAKIMYYRVYRDRIISEPHTLSDSDLVRYVSALCPRYFRNNLEGKKGDQYYTVPVRIPPVTSTR